MIPFLIKYPIKRGILGRPINSTPSASLRLQIVATRCGVITNVRQGTTGARTDVRNESRNKMFVGQYDVSNIQIGIGGYKLTQPGEADMNNIFTQEFAVEVTTPSPSYQLCLFSGVSLVSVAVGLSNVLSSPLTYTIPGGGSFFLRQAATVSAAALFFPLGGQVKVTGASDYMSASTTSQTAGTGALVDPGSSGIQSPHPPLVVLGTCAGPTPAIIVAGDSITAGSNDLAGDATTGSTGFAQRGLASVNGYPVPYCMQAVAGLRMRDYRASVSPKMRDLWKYATHLLIAFGVNDIALTGASFATIQGYLNEILTDAKATIGPYGYPLQTAVVKITPSTSSTDSWKAAADQTPNAGFGVGQTRDQYNSWIVSQVGLGLIDAVVDTSQYIEDPAHPGKWLTTGVANAPTSDGTHPSTAYHILAAKAVNDWALTLTVNPTLSPENITWGDGTAVTSGDGTQIQWSA